MMMSDEWCQVSGFFEERPPNKKKNNNNNLKMSSDMRSVPDPKITLLIYEWTYNVVYSLFYS